MVETTGSHDDAASTLPQESAAEPQGRLCTNGFIATYLDYTRNQASPTLFHIWTAISIMAAALRRNVYIDRGGYYTLYPNLYTVLVAPTGRCMKSTAAGMGVRLLRRIDGPKIVHEKITPEGLITYLEGSLNGHSTPAKSQFKIKKDGSFTAEIHGKHVKLNAQSNCYIFAPELSVFLGGVSYTAGLIELLTSLYEGKDKWEYRTKTHGETELYNVNINLFGASNPEWLSKGFSEDAFGGGFMGRTIFVFQDEGKKVAWPMKPPEMEELKTKLVHDLMKMSELHGEYLITKEAREFYTNWYDGYAGDFSGRMAGYYERKPDHILKIAMIIAASKSDTLIIEPNHMQQALEMLERVEELMPKAFAYIGATNEARVSQHIIEIIASSPHHFISYRRLISSIRHMIKNRKEFDDIMDTLESTGQVKGYTRGGARYFTLDEEIAKYLAAVECVAEEEAQREFKEVKETDMAAAATQVPASASVVVKVEDDKPTTIRELVTTELEKLK